MTALHQPKGGMCRTCVHLLRNCSTLPFDQMPVIERTPAADIVRCTEYKRRAIVAAKLGETASVPAELLETKK